MRYWYKKTNKSTEQNTVLRNNSLCIYICKVYSQGCQIHKRERTGSIAQIPRFHQLLCILTPDFHVQFPYPGWQSRQRIQIGPKQSLLPNSTETPAPTCGWEALPRTVPRGASSQGPGHRVMGRWDLSGDDRAEGRPRVSVHVQESHRTLQSQTRLASPEKGISGRTD